MDHTNIDTPFSAQPGISVARYTAKTYLLMFFGLLLTFGVSAAVVWSGLVYDLLLNFGLMMGLFIVEVVLVIVLSAMLKKLSPAVSAILFIGYAILNGFTLSSIAVIYEVSSVVLVFAVTSLVFGIMAIWGYTTKQDLSSWKKVLIFGLFGIIIMTLLGFFLNLSKLEFIISLAGVALFLGFTAYDTQKIKAFYMQYQGDEAMLAKVSIISALQLYLDYINLFLYLLRLLGKKN